MGASKVPPFHCGRTEYVLTLGIQVLSVLDLVFTLIQISMGGSESNPLMDWALRRGPVSFASLKMTITTLGLMILIKGLRFHRSVRLILAFLCACYVAVIGRHVELFATLP
jgi:hypothetical protein